MSYSDPAGWGFWFNRDGSRLAYGAQVEGGWVMVVDGVRSPMYRRIDFRQGALNGKRLVYVAQTADQQWHVVVDGKPGPAFGGITSLTLTPDGAHYAYVAQRAGVGAQMAFAVVDGVESPAYLSVSDLEQAPDGRVPPASCYGVLRAAGLPTWAPAPPGTSLSSTEKNSRQSG